VHLKALSQAVKTLSALLSLVLFLGCASSFTHPLTAPSTPRIVCFVPGVAGDAGGYDGLKNALHESGAADLRVFTWGAPGPLFMLNFQSRSIHESAEKQLAARLTDWLGQKPGCRIDLIGHSAGCGVILGALGRLAEGCSADRVILLSPSVSPGYDLSPPLRHVSGRMDVFFSDRDVFFLKWRTGTFGTYDNVRTPAAGHLSFQPQAPLAPELSRKLTQHPYNPDWRALGNDGDHLGSAAHDFIRSVVAPLLNGGGP
jgi:pimeloyl-ACP methyl ester carboxylesterase